MKPGVIDPVHTGQPDACEAYARATVGVGLEGRDKGGSLAAGPGDVSRLPGLEAADSIGEAKDDGHGLRCTGETPEIASV